MPVAALRKVQKAAKGFLPIIVYANHSACYPIHVIDSLRHRWPLRID